MPTPSNNSFRELLDLNFDRAFGLDISDSSIEIAELSKVVEYSLKTYGKLELPDGAIIDGAVQNEPALAESVKALLRSVRPRVSTNKVVVSLPENQVLIHHFIMDTLSKGTSVRFMVETEIAKLIPIAPQKMYWDIRSKPLGGGKMGVIFVGVKKEIADAYSRVCNSIGLDIVSFGLEPLCIARLFLDPGEILTAIVDIGAQVTNVSIVRGNNDLDLAISIHQGGDRMTQAIAETMKIPPAEAEKSKLNVPDLAPPVAAAVQPIVKTIAEEVNKAIRYYEETYSEAVAKVLIVGGASVSNFVVATLKEGLSQKREVIVADHFRDKSAPYPFHLRSKDASQSKVIPMVYTTVIGLGMLGASNEFGDINLLKAMPPLTTNRFKKSDLFKVGYLSRVTALRIFLQNRTMLVIAGLLCILSLTYFGYSTYVYRLNVGIQAINDIPQVKLIHPFNSGQMLKVSSTTVMTKSSTSTASTSTVPVLNKKK